LTRVCLIGLPPIEEQRVVKEFKDLLDLRIWNDNKANYKQLRAMAAGAEVCLVMTSRVSHQTEDTLKRHNIPYKRVLGTVNAAIDALTEVYANE
jgi:hypothetical protein